MMRVPGLAVAGVLALTAPLAAHAVPLGPSIERRLPTPGIFKVWGGCGLGWYPVPGHWSRSGGGWWVPPHCVPYRYFGWRLPYDGWENAYGWGGYYSPYHDWAQSLAIPDSKPMLTRQPVGGFKLPSRTERPVALGEAATEPRTGFNSTAARSQVRDRVQGLDRGADDYVVKPVDLDELAARLRALVRRAHGHTEQTMRVDDVVLDPAARTVSRAGAPVVLSQREFDLLHTLLLNAGRVLTREQLEQRLYGWGREVESNAVEVHVHSLRRKLGSALIRTVRGVGYMLASGGEEP